MSPNLTRYGDVEEANFFSVSNALSKVIILFQANSKAKDSVEVCLSDIANFRHNHSTCVEFKSNAIINTYSMNILDLSEVCFPQAVS